MASFFYSVFFAIVIENPLLFVVSICILIELLDLNLFSNARRPGIYSAIIR